MTDEPQKTNAWPALDRLTDVVVTIRRLTEDHGSIHTARSLPNRYAREANVMEITPRSSYGQRASDQAVAAARRLRELVEAEERARGEAERDEQLRAIQRDIESFRSVLPNLAAKAAVELGVLAREIDPDRSEPEA